MAESPPTKLHFENQDPDENILLLCRAHVITNLPWILFVTFLFLVPFLITGTNIFDQILDPLGVNSTSARALALCWYFLTFAIAIQNILHWYFNVYIVTNKRIVDIDCQQLR